MTVPGSAGGQPGQLTVTAVDVEHPIPLADPAGVEQELVEPAIDRVVAVHVSRPVLTLIAAPRRRLRGIVAHCHLNLLKALSGLCLLFGAGVQRPRVIVAREAIAAVDDAYLRPHKASL